MTVNNQYRVQWYHSAAPGSGGSLCIIKELVPAIKIFGIEILPGYERIFSEGKVKLHPKDHFNRKIGLFESFKRAVDSIEERQTRKVIWNEFWKTRQPINYKQR